MFCQSPFEVGSPCVPAGSIGDMSNASKVHGRAAACRTVKSGCILGAGWGWIWIDEPAAGLLAMLSEMAVSFLHGALSVPALQAGVRHSRVSSAM